MSGVFSYIAARKRSWLSYFSVFLMLCSIVPLLNSSFFLLNSSYYARWNYMMILMFCVATVIALDDRAHLLQARSDCQRRRLRGHCDPYRPALVSGE